MKIIQEKLEYVTKNVSWIDWTNHLLKFAKLWDNSYTNIIPDYLDVKKAEGMKVAREWLDEWFSVIADRDKLVILDSLETNGESNG